MKQYIELSKEYKVNNKSQEIIGKLYDLMNLLEKDENKMVLVYAYTLLAYHKKAYDLYLMLRIARKMKNKVHRLLPAKGRIRFSQII